MRVFSALALAAGLLLSPSANPLRGEDAAERKWSFIVFHFEEIIICEYAN